LQALRHERGERRAADVVGCAVKVTRVATREIDDERLKQPAKSRSGKADAVANHLGKYGEIAVVAAKARWE